MILEVKEASFWYDVKHPVLENINFKINEGDIVSILGPNGVGKTTLLKCVIGLLEWKKGYTYFNDISINEIVKKTFFQQVSYVPQSHNISFPCSVFETVLLGRSSYIGMFQAPSKIDKEKAMEAIRLSGIDNLIDANINQISGGEQQLVYIARALCTDPKVIVLDEPETSLDYSNQVRVLSLLKKLSKEKKITVIFNTHYPDHALDISNKTLFLKKDGTSIFGNTNEILTEKNLTEVFHVNISLVDNIIDGKKYTTLIPIMKEGVD